MVKTQVMTLEVEAVDTPTMEAMSDSEYSEYLRYRLFSVDHHDVLRSELTGHPYAVTRAQFKLLLEYLETLVDRVGAEQAR